METTTENPFTTITTEIAPGIHRIATHVPFIAPPAGFTFCQFVIDGDEPFLFHTGSRQLFPAVSSVVDELVGLDRLRWISFGHVESDECGAMNDFLAVAPDAQVIHGETAVMVSLNDLCDRMPAVATDVLEIGGHRMRFIPTPHVPHNWESGIWFDETTRTVLCGDLFTSLGDGDPIVETDLVEGAMVAEAVFGATAIGPAVPETLRRLAELEPTTLACMHGSSFRGDGGSQLRSLAEAYDAMLGVPA